MGRAIAARGLTLVYGGARVGLMGAVANAALEAGGRVVGVNAEVARHEGDRARRSLRALPHRDDAREEGPDHHAEQRVRRAPRRLRHLRRALRDDRARAIGLHDKPNAMLDTNGFFQPLVSLLRHTIGHSFAAPEHERLLVNEREPEALLERNSGVQHAAARVEVAQSTRLAVTPREESLPALWARLPRRGERTREGQRAGARLLPCRARRRERDCNRARGGGERANRGDRRSVSTSSSRCGNRTTTRRRRGTSARSMPAELLVREGAAGGARRARLRGDRGPRLLEGRYPRRAREQSAPGRRPPRRARCDRPRAHVGQRARHEASVLRARRSVLRITPRPTTRAGGSTTCSRSSSSCRNSSTCRPPRALAKERVDFIHAFLTSRCRSEIFGLTRPVSRQSLVIDNNND